MKQLFSSIRTTSVRILTHWKPRRWQVQTAARLLLQPRIQYPIALLLITILIYALGWVLLCVTLPHIPFALISSS